MTSIPIREEKKKKTHRGEDDVKTEAETRAVSLQAKESHRSLAATGSQEKVPNEFFPQNQPWQHLDFTLERKNFCCFQPPSLWQPWEATTHCNW